MRKLLFSLAALLVSASVFAQSALPTAASAVTGVTGISTIVAGTGTTVAVAGNSRTVALAPIAAHSILANVTAGSAIPTANPYLANLSGSTATVGGGALLAGACAAITVAITGATTAMAVVATPVTYPGDGNYWTAYVSSAGVVTVSVCAAVAGTPVTSVYRVRVIQ